MATHEQTKKAGGNDVGDWGGKSMKGAYPAGTEFDTGTSKTKFSELHGVVPADDDAPAKPTRAPLRR